MSTGIIGGGISGLSFALRASSISKSKFTLYESSQVSLKFENNELFENLKNEEVRYLGLGVYCISKF